MLFRSRKRETSALDASGDRPVAKKKRHALRDFLRSLRTKEKARPEHANGNGNGNGNGNLKLEAPVDMPQPPTKEIPVREGPSPTGSQEPAQLPSEPERLGRFEREPPKPPSTSATATTPDAPKEDARGLAEDEIQALFSGAPHFSVCLTKERRQPGVAFPWDTSLEIRDVSDFSQLSHPAFSLATLRRHLPAGGVDPDSRSLLGYDLELFEMPSMLSAQGLERGTIGFEYFLELPIADSLLTEEVEDPSKSGLSEASRNNELLYTNSDKLGIRALDIYLIQDRFIELGAMYENFKADEGKSTILDVYKPEELYADLFGKFLSPPRFDSTTSDPTGLKVQVETIMKILKLKGIWCDLGLVEWRIKIGQVIWETQEDESDGSMDMPIEGKSRSMILLQLLLACELLLRLDAIAAMDADRVKNELHLTVDEVKNFQTIKTRKVDWDLVLARRFLENVEVREATQKPPEPDPSSTRFGFLASLSSQKQQPPSEEGPELQYIFLPKNQARQFNGLFHFATAISWPNVEDVQAKMSSKLKMQGEASQEDKSNADSQLALESPASQSIYGTPLPTPRSIRSSYFGHLSPRAMSPRPTMSRSTTQQSVRLHSPLPTSDGDEKRPKNVDPEIGGWLSRTYMMGLILPGEIISHFLISTLLENDKEAIAVLGEAANLYGGFVYSGRSWWSKTCIVGRVLACLDGSSECMGWISVPVVPDKFQDGWLDIVSESPPPGYAKVNHPGLVEQDTRFWPESETGIVLAQDFIQLTDAALPEPPRIQVWEFALKEILVGSEESEIEIENPVLEDPEDIVYRIGTYAATLSFLISSTDDNGDTNETPYSFRLSHDVYYITSYPCTPPSASELIQHTQIPISQPGDATNDTDNLATTVASHPLHTSYNYSIHPAISILSPDFSLNKLNTGSDDADAEAEPTEEAIEDEEEHNKTSDEVFILDARNAGNELELLARAWCAERGYHALIARTGRTCLACCVREARGLDVKVVIRV